MADSKGLYSNFLFKLRFIPCKAAQPLRDMVMQEKEEEKDENDPGKLIRKILKKKGVY